MYTPGMGGAYAPAGWGQPPTGGGATGVPQHGFYTPGNSYAAPNVSTGWGASTTAAPVDPQVQAVAEAAEMTKFIQTLGGVVGRSHTVIQQNLSGGGYTDLWLLKNATVEQMVGTGVLQAHAQYIYAALHQEVMRRCRKKCTFQPRRKQRQKAHSKNYHPEQEKTPEETSCQNQQRRDSHRV